MNYRTTEKNKRIENASANRGFTCLAPLLCIVIVGFICWGVPLLNLTIHFIQWKLQGIEKYEIELSIAGLTIPNYLEPAEDDDGLLSFDSLHLRQEYSDVITMLFRDALSRLITPLLCTVTYHPQYGFPDKMVCYEGTGMVVKNFRPLVDD